MRYAKYYWNENRGDEFSHWGNSWWYFEIDLEGYLNRQIEVYDSGIRLRYDRENIEDQFGALGEGKEEDYAHDAKEKMSANEFNIQWNTGPWHNVSAS